MSRKTLLQILPIRDAICLQRFTDALTSHQRRNCVRPLYVPRSLTAISVSCWSEMTRCAPTICAHHWAPFRHHAWLPARRVRASVHA